MDKNENTAYQISWETSRTMLWWKSIAINAYIKKKRNFSN